MVRFNERFTFLGIEIDYLMSVLQECEAISLLHALYISVYH